jgi:hypothetical protein
MSEPFANWPEAHKYLIEVQSRLEEVHDLTGVPFATEAFRSAVSDAITGIEPAKEIAAHEEQKRILRERKAAFLWLRQQGAPELACLLPEELRPGSLADGPE